nr:reverse transcriptase domain-containing protein [Tanacetum cinerariifolium]
MQLYDMKPSHPINLFNLTPFHKTHCHLGNLEKPHLAEQQDKDSRVEIDLIEGQGKWRVKMEVLSSLTTKAQLAQYHFVFETTTTTNQGMIVEEIEQIVTQRVVNAIEAIAIYETKTSMARELMSQNKRQGDKVVEIASNKRNWESNHNGSSSQQNKEHKVFRAYTTEPSNKKVYAGNLPWCNKCKYHHTGPCAEKCGQCKRVGHQAGDCRILVSKAKPRLSMAKQKDEVTCYHCGNLGHYRKKRPLLKFLNRVDKYWKGKAREDFSITTSNANI